MPIDWEASESAGTLKELQARVELAVLKADDDITAALERARIEYAGGTYFVDRGGFMNMSRDANLGFDFLDKAARRRASHRRPVHQPVAFGLVGRRMADHHQRPLVLNFEVAAPQRVVDLVLGKLHGGVKGRDIGTAAAEQSDAVDHHPTPVQR